MALPGSGNITLNQIKAEFNKGNNLRAYLGAAPGVPTSGWLAITDFYGKSAADFHYGYPYTYTSTDLGYYYDYVENDAGRSGWYSADNLDAYYGDNFGTYQDLGQTELSMSIANSGDASIIYNSYMTLFFCIDSDKYNAAIQTSGYWNYSDFVGANAIYYTDYDNYYFNAAYSWLSGAYSATEYFMEMS